MSIVDSRPEVGELQAELDQCNRTFESAPAGKIVAWAVERFGSKLAMACSFQDAVLIDMAMQVDPAIEVVFLDTGSHFPETLAYVEAVRARYDLNLAGTHPVAGGRALARAARARCCEIRKVVPLDQALAGKEAWMTGLKRVDAPTRAAGPHRVLGRELGTGEDQSHGHLDRRRRRPATSPTTACPSTRCCPRGYLSIGCAPTTRPVAAGRGPPRRALGRAADKTECGLHV